MNYCKKNQKEVKKKWLIVTRKQKQVQDLVKN